MSALYVCLLGGVHPLGAADEHADPRAVRRRRLCFQRRARAEDGRRLGQVICLPYMSALYVCLMCQRRARAEGGRRLGQVTWLPYVSALLVCLICHR